MADDGAEFAPAHGAPRPARPGDRWAHRRGEPRVFALLWSVYLFGAAVATVFSVRFIGMQQADMFHPATRALLALAAIGVTVLWPMVRLSQLAPDRPLRATVSDVVALLLPLQAIIWPTKMLTGWSWALTSGVATLLTSWAILTGAIIGAALSAPAQPTPPGLPRERAALAGRSWWMLTCIVATVAAPTMLAGVALLGGAPAPAQLALASPISAVYAMTSAPSGLSARMTPETWIAATAPAVIGGAGWLALGALRGRSRPAAHAAARRLH